MEGERRSSSRRKPLADCTNTIAAAAGRKFTPSAAKSTAGPPKPSISAVTKPSPKPLTSSSSIKATTSTGSNNPPNVDSVLSTPHTDDPPAPPTPLSDSGSRERRKIGASTAQSQQDEKTRKGKGNRLSEVPIIQGAKLVTRQALMRSSSTASGNWHLSQKSAGQTQDGKMFMETLNTKTTKHSTLHASLKSSSAASGNCHLSGPPAVQNKKLDVEKRKNHEEMVLEAPNIKTSEFLGCHVPQASSSAASGNCHISGPSAVQDPKLDAQRRKEKGKMVLETPIIEITDLLKSHVPMASSCAASGNWHCSEPPPFHDQNLNGQKMKDKGKMVLETPNIEATDLLGSHKSLASSSAASGYCHLPGSPAVQNETSDAQKRKDKGKMVLEAPIIEITDPLRPHMSLASCSAASGNVHLSGFPAVPNQKMDSRKWKDKGKVVLKTPNIVTTDLFRPLKSLASSSAALGDGHLSGPPAVQNKKLGNQESMDKGNRILETQTIETIDSGRLQAPLTSSSAASRSDYLFGPPLVEYHKLDEAKSKDKGRMVQETLDIETTDPSTPQASLASSSATSGARDQEKPIFLTVYNQRRALRRRKHADGKSIALSCPPNKRAKNMGVGLDDGSGKKKSGSNTDPLPVRKKPRKTHDDPVHIMPPDEIERLRAYYAEIDAFELTEEVAADSD